MLYFYKWICIYQSQPYLQAWLGMLFIKQMRFDESCKNSSAAWEPPSLRVGDPGPDGCFSLVPLGNKGGSRRPNCEASALRAALDTGEVGLLKTSSNSPFTPDLRPGKSCTRALFIH